MSGYVRISWDIMDLRFWDSVLAVGMAGICQDISGYPGISWTWDSGTLCWLLAWLGYVGISQDILDLGVLAVGMAGICWDILDLGFWDSMQAVGIVGICQRGLYIPGYLRLGILGLCWLSAWLGYVKIYVCQDILGYLGLGSSTLHPVSRAGIYWDSGTL